MILAEQLHARILEELDLTREIEDEELTQLIYRVLNEASQQEYLPLAQKTALGKELFNAFRKLDLLEEFLEDDEIKIKMDAKKLYDAFKKEYGSVQCGIISKNGEDKSPCVDCCVYAANEAIKLLKE